MNEITVEDINESYMKCSLSDIIILKAKEMFMREYVCTELDI